MRTLATLTGLALLAIACGGDGSSPTPSPTPAVAPTTTASPVPSLTAAPEETSKTTPCPIATSLIPTESDSDSEGLFLIDIETGKNTKLSEAQFVAWSPDGCLLALLSRTGCPEGCDREPSTLEILDLTTGDRSALFTGFINRFEWAPDSQRLAITSNIPGNPFTYDLYIVDTKGNATKIVEAFPDTLWPPRVQWSPDGGVIAFTTGTGLGHHQAGMENVPPKLVLISTQGQEVRSIEMADGQPFSEIHEFLWSPRGDKLAFTASLTSGDPASQDVNLFLINRAGSGLMALLPAPTLIRGIQWSPDGTRLLYGGIGSPWIYTISPGHPPQMIAEGVSPAWSPDGQHIAFIASDCETFDVAVVNADGTGMAVLTPGFEAPKFGPAWSPDGSQIAFDAITAEASGLYVMSSDGTGLRPVRPSTVFAHHEWSPSGKFILSTVGVAGRGYCEDF